MVARAIPVEHIGDLNYCIVLGSKRVPILRGVCDNLVKRQSIPRSGQPVLKPTASRMIARYAWMNRIHSKSTLVPATDVHRASTRTGIDVFLAYPN